MAKLTLENFDENNRDRKIGHSLYRICQNDKKKWYIYEIYNNGNTFAHGRAFYDDNLHNVINKINSFTREREIIDLALSDRKHSSLDSLIEGAESRSDNPVSENELSRNENDSLTK